MRYVANTVSAVLLVMLSGTLRLPAAAQNEGTGRDVESAPVFFGKGQWISKSGWIDKEVSAQAPDHFASETGTVFQVQEPGKRSLWVLRLSPPVPVGKGSTLTIRYRAERVAAATDVPVLLGLSLGNGRWSSVPIVQAADLVCDGRLQSLERAVSGDMDEALLDGLAIQVSCEAAPADTIARFELLGFSFAGLPGSASQSPGPAADGYRLSITDKLKKAVSAALVIPEPVPREAEASLKTDAAGAVTVPGYAPPNVLRCINILADGYCPAWLAAWRLAEQQEVHVCLPGTVSCSGTVLETDEKPVAAASVSLQAYRSPRSSCKTDMAWRVLTDAQGHWQVPCVPDDATVLWLTVTTPSLALPSKRFSLVEGNLAELLDGNYVTVVKTEEVEGEGKTAFSLRTDPDWVERRVLDDTEADVARVEALQHLADLCLSHENGPDRLLYLCLLFLKESPSPISVRGIIAVTQRAEKAQSGRYDDPLGTLAMANEGELPEYVIRNVHAALDGELFGAGDVTLHRTELPTAVGPDTATRRFRESGGDSDLAGMRSLTTPLRQTHLPVLSQPASPKVEVETIPMDVKPVDSPAPVDAVAVSPSAMAIPSIAEINTPTAAPPPLAAPSRSPTWDDNPAVPPVLSEVIVPALVMLDAGLNGTQRRAEAVDRVLLEGMCEEIRTNAKQFSQGVLRLKYCEAAQKTASTPELFALVLSSMAAVLESGASGQTPADVADILLETFPQQHPRRYVALHGALLYCYRADAIEKATALADEIVASFPEHEELPSVYLLRALCHLKRGDHEKTERDLKLVLGAGASPQIAQARFLLGWLYVFQQNYAGAREELKRVCTDFPETPFAEKANVLLSRISDL